MSRAPLSLAMHKSTALLVDAGGATWFELSDKTHADPMVPTGGSFAEIAGGG